MSEGVNLERILALVDSLRQQEEDARDSSSDPTVSPSLYRSLLGVIARVTDERQRILLVIEQAKASGRKKLRWRELFPPMDA